MLPNTHSDSDSHSVSESEGHPKKEKTKENIFVCHCKNVKISQTNICKLSVIAKEPNLDKQFMEIKCQKKKSCHISWILDFFQI